MFRIKMIRSSRDNLVWIISHRLREGNNFFLGTKNKEYWRRMIERDIEGATMFYVGQKVVCVDDKSWITNQKWHSTDRLFKGSIYTIQNIKLNVDVNKLDLYLVEIQRCKEACEHWGYEVGYASERFRPLIEKKTDISIFTAMLNKNKELV